MESCFGKGSFFYLIRIRTPEWAFKKIFSDTIMIGSATDLMKNTGTDVRMSDYTPFCSNKALPESKVVVFNSLRSILNNGFTAFPEA